MAGVIKSEEPLRKIEALLTGHSSHGLARCGSGQEVRLEKCRGGRVGLSRARCMKSRGLGEGWGQEVFKYTTGRAAGLPGKLVVTHMAKAPIGGGGEGGITF